MTSTQQGLNNKSADINKKSVRVRFAPSPTGFPHMGNARVAIYNYIFAKQHNGKFFLRFEDTDRERSKIIYEESIKELLYWLDIKPEKEVWLQSERSQVYERFLNILIANNKTYFCQCSALNETHEQEQQNKNHCECEKLYLQTGAVRFKIDRDRSLTLKDIIVGDVTINTNTLENFVLRRTDGSYTYNFAVVVDDIEMEISHIFRGNDHLYNSFKQLLLYEAFKAELPVFGHIPMIGGEDGAKLSKRLGTGNVLHYKQTMGIISEAMFVYLATLSGGFGDIEPRTREDIIKHFDIRKISKSQASFDENKLLSLSGDFLKLEDKKYLGETLVHINKLMTGTNTSVVQFVQVNSVFTEFAKRSKTLEELAKSLMFIYKDLEIDQALYKQLNKDTIQAIIDALKDVDDHDEALVSGDFIISGNNWNEEYLHSTFKHKFHDLKSVCDNLRISILNRLDSPSIFWVIAGLGKKDTLHKLNLQLS